MITIECSLSLAIVVWKRESRDFLCGKQTAKMKQSAKKKDLGYISSINCSLDLLDMDMDIE
jgi:hypothetical protein